MGPPKIRDRRPAVSETEHDGASALGARDGGPPLRLVIRTDGASRGNPGPASCGAILLDAARPDAHDPGGEPLAVLARALGVRTNNVAEYAGLVLALREARRLGADEVELLLDSKLIVEQLNRRWRVKDAKLRGLFEEAQRHLATFRRWSAAHEPRARNHAADALANLALDDPAAAALVVAAIARRHGREATPEDVEPPVGQDVPSA
jgi:probable phosphoglycerate mutase